MIRLFLAISVSTLAVLSSSCLCCNSDKSAAPLRPMPKFKEIPSEAAAEAPITVEHTK